MVPERHRGLHVRNDPINNLFGSRSWTVEVTNADPPPPPAPVRNISTRLQVQLGDAAPIGGFILNGTAPKKVVIRGIGPSLRAAGIANAVADTQLQLFRGSTPIGSNRNWRDSQEAEIRATGLMPGDEREAAMLVTLEPGSYTALMNGENGAIGVGLVEIYDAEQTSGATLANISTRGSVGTQDDVMIGGFIVGQSGSGTARVAVRAIGPSLTAFGVPGALQDPKVGLYNQQGTLMQENDNWRDGPAAELHAVRLVPNDPREAALTETVGPGNYTAIVRGVGGATGIGLVEIYAIPQ
jgi:hypothetical protein